MKLRCVECGKEFEPNKTNQLCCSPECARKRKIKMTVGYHNGTRTVKKREPKVPDGRHWGVCKECGQEMRVNRFGVCKDCMRHLREAAGRLDGDWIFI